MQATSPSVPAVDGFSHKSWKTTTSIPVGVWNPSEETMQVVSLSTIEMGHRCHELDLGIRKVQLVEEDNDNDTAVALRPPDRDGKRRPLQPGELALDSTTTIPWPTPKTTTKTTTKTSPRPWFVPFCVMPNMNNNGDLFDRWQALVLQLVNDHRVPGKASIPDLALAHEVLPPSGTKAFGTDLHLQAQRLLADRLTAEWNGQQDALWLKVYTDTIRRVVQPFMAQYYNCTQFYVQKHPKNLRLQMPFMKSVQHWHCDRMFGHPPGEINFSLCLTEFCQTAGICLELSPTQPPFPIVAGAGSIVVAPFGYCPHGNLENTEDPPHTRVSIDWRIITVEDMHQAISSHNGNLGASATSGLDYVPGAYYGLWDASISNWVEPPKAPVKEPAASE